MPSGDAGKPALSFKRNFGNYSERFKDFRQAQVQICTRRMCSSPCPEPWSYAMSSAEIKRFAADLKSNSALRTEAEKSQADKSHAAPLERFVAFAASKGYGFTIEEAKQHVQARAAAKGQIITDAQLDGVAGGVSLYITNPFDSWCFST
jgi:hypothetical protein